jgi:hypothetical protein
VGFFFKRRFVAGTACLIAALAVACCAAPAAGDDCKRVQNILVVFDASGYMKEKDHYSLLMQQMEFFKEAIPLTADGFFNVGLRHYGFKVGLGCQNTESIFTMQPWDPERFLNSFPKTVSYGMSSLAAAVRAAAEEAAAADGKTIVVFVGGGLESCKADPVLVADRVAFNYPELEIHTFQIGSDSEGKFFLEAIAKKCRGTYHDLRSMGGSAGWHAWMKQFLVAPCAGPAAAAPPPPPPAQVGPIIFDSNSFTVRSRDPNIDASNRASLEAVGRFLQSQPKSRVVLHGYSDGKGAQDLNLKLSRRRAEVVAQFLAVQYGITDARVAIVAHGAAAKVAPGQPGAGRMVVFEVID